MKTYIVKTINVERHECKYSIDADNEKEARDNFLTDGEQYDDDLLDSDCEEVISVEEERP